MPDVTASLADHTSKAAPPRCEVLDLIVPWSEVQAGDLVLCGGQLHQLEGMWPAGLLPGQVGIRVLREGRMLNHYVDSNALTAVRRYVTEGE